MVLRVITIATLVAAGHAVAAQTPGQTQVAPEAKHQVALFEGSLRAAIEKAGGDMLKRASEVVPDIRLRFEAEIRVYSAILAEGDMFMVDVPAIEATSLQMFTFLLKTSPAQASRMSNPVDPANSSAGSAPPAAPSMMNPDLLYSEFTRQALVDAMLDNGITLPLKEGQRLTVVVGVPGGIASGQIGGAPRKLYLSIKSEDLLALRERKIDREEARKRIEENRY